MNSRTVLRRVAAVRTPDGAQLHAVVDGRDDAPVTLVLAHGWTLAQATWDDVAELLAPRVADGELRLIRYDQRGHGRSTWGSPTHPDTSITIDLLGEDLGTLLDQLVPDGPVVLGGHSMGGMTIMCLSAARPELFGDRVRGVVLVATSAGDLTSDPRSAAAAWPSCTRACSTPLSRAPASSSGCASCCPRRTPGTRRWCATCSTGPTPPTRWC
ncbi:alpha/beta fold hydrolase [Blastococcus sp. PRF04-17]|uniref:alpha/beta fold hydrolase n=1 Tax=Blastococcus sp. PRF04-17 TaxID=2933797 RepID=UPI001FF3A458|nr:alpha/beta hydrolase [Blastococcus sp. PRF04-17]UOY02973.1 alpha/beta hydrolase [Blastococcus sp. PRF04-17]